ncbi:hypothetical protein LOK49_LG08G01163 [Camellia lanceoleosa]|uniref:Uncharacterized protein n=1 Tax=Camellia lanceoleosa TaxID=1840588 RepID=A0ACC0GVA4_9ERIC|nr:hypothetical protein LOK49_LG08G01163 [Camellia lanceoleosa]
MDEPESSRHKEVNTEIDDQFAPDGKDDVVDVKEGSIGHTKRTCKKLASSGQRYRDGCTAQNMSPLDVPKIIWQVVDSVAKANNPHAALPFGLLVTDMLLELVVPTQPDDEWKE